MTSDTPPSTSTTPTTCKCGHYNFAHYQHGGTECAVRGCLCSRFTPAGSGSSDATRSAVRDLTGLDDETLDRLGGFEGSDASTPSGSDTGTDVTYCPAHGRQDVLGCAACDIGRERDAAVQRAEQAEAELRKLGRLVEERGGDEAGWWWTAQIEVALGVLDADA